MRHQGPRQFAYSVLAWQLKSMASRTGCVIVTRAAGRPMPLSLSLSSFLLSSVSPIFIHTTLLLLLFRHRVRRVVMTSLRNSPLCVTCDHWRLGWWRWLEWPRSIIPPSWPPYYRPHHLTHKPPPLILFTLTPLSLQVYFCSIFIDEGSSIKGMTSKECSLPYKNLSS